MLRSSLVQKPIVNTNILLSWFNETEDKTESLVQRCLLLPWAMKLSPNHHTDLSRQTQGALELALWLGCHEVPTGIHFQRTQRAGAVTQGPRGFKFGAHHPRRAARNPRGLAPSSDILRHPHTSNTLTQTRTHTYKFKLNFKMS